MGQYMDNKSITSFNVSFIKLQVKEHEFTCISIGHNHPQHKKIEFNILQVLTPKFLYCNNQRMIWINSQLD